MAPFECKVGSILQCQCSGLVFTDAEKDYIYQRYPDCLCRNCLQHIRHEINALNVQQKVRSILAITKSREQKD